MRFKNIVFYRKILFNLRLIDFYDVIFMVWLFDIFLLKKYFLHHQPLFEENLIVITFKYY